MGEKPFWQSKTFWLNFITGVIMFLEGQQVIDLLPPTWTPYIAAVVFGLNIILRFNTKEPVIMTLKGRRIS